VYDIVQQQRSRCKPSNFPLFSWHHAILSTEFRVMSSSKSFLRLALVIILTAATVHVYHTMFAATNSAVCAFDVALA
jgi:hypothetical protein